MKSFSLFKSFVTGMGKAPERAYLDLSELYPYKQCPHVWHRVDRDPKLISSNGHFRGFVGREHLSTHNLYEYILNNQSEGQFKNFGGFGGVGYLHHADNFIKTWRPQQDNFTYSAVPPKNKLIINIHEFIQQSGIQGGILNNRATEFEMLLIGDLAKEFIFTSTNQLNDLIDGKEVQNFLSRNDNDLPASYTAMDVSNPYQMLLWMIKNRCFTGVHTLVNYDLAPVTPIVLEIAKKSGHKGIQEILETAIAETNAQSTLKIKR